MTIPSFPVPQASVEEGLLNSIGNDMNRWLEVSKFSSEDFTSRRDVFQFIGNYLEQYQNLPSATQISTRFDWNPPLGDFEYWLKEMKRYSLARQVLEVVKEGYDRITEPEEAMNILVDKLSLIRSKQDQHIQAYDSSALERLAKFDMRTEYIFNSEEIIGLRTGMKIYDNTKIGWTPGSLVGVFARPGVGKTWWLLWQGIQAWKAGLTVLLISPEMPANMLSLRIDTLMANGLGIHINYNMLMVGDPAIRDNYKVLTEALSQTQRWWTYDSYKGEAVSLANINTLIHLHKPDLVLVDGVSLLKATSRGQTWEQMKELCYGLKMIATVKDVPIIMTHQAVNSARGRRTERTQMVRGDDDIMPSLNDAAFGDAFVQACSDVITMCGEPESQYINWYSIRKWRERSWQGGLPARMAFVVNFGIGMIHDLSELGYDRTQVGNEARRLTGL